MGRPACLILLWSAGLLGWGATYYVDDAGGNDAAGGLSPSTAWKSIARVHAGSYQPGDFVLFRRGGVWREELSNNTGLALVTHGAYGTGPDPMILGSQSRHAAFFSPVAGTVYAVSHSDPGGILASLNQPGDHGVWWIEESGAVTSLVRGASGSPAPGRWSYDGATLYVNVGGLPSGAFEICARSKCVEVWTGTRFQNLAFRYGLDGNFNLGCSDFRFDACEFAYNADNGIETGSNGSVGPGYFSRCRIHHNGRDGVYHHYTSVTGFMHLDYCLIHDNGGHGVLEETSTNVEYAANLLRHCTISGNGGWGVWADVVGLALYLKVYNCISVGNASGELAAVDEAGMFILSASNCVGPAGRYGGKWAQSAYHTSDLAVDPLFLDASYTSISGVWRVVDARLSPQSPCIDAASATELDRDLGGRGVPFGIAPDIGCFEFAPAALPHDGLDAALDADAVQLVSDATTGLALWVRQLAESLYLAVLDSSRIIASTDVVYLAFARQGVEYRFTLPDNPATNPDYATLSESAVACVKPWDGLGEGGGYLRFNYDDSPTSEFIGDATGLLGASRTTGVIELLVDRTLSHLSTSSTFVWVVVVSPDAPSEIKASLPREGAPADHRVNHLAELLRVDGMVVQSAIGHWRAMR
ncbi:right-handed parallel beta-helix repeat-containing protein [bacterium]|nr:right-handed parallel beta-helix repeat-containing protein [bacterium]